MQIFEQHPVADFTCSACGCVLSQVYLDDADKTCLMSFNLNGMVTSYRATLICSDCGEAKQFFSTTASALRLGCVNYGK
jgi:hypothetical protein